MRYSLLQFLRCVDCGVELTCFTDKEIAAPFDGGRFAPFDRVSPQGAGVGPPPVLKLDTPLTVLLQRHGSEPDPDRNLEVEVAEGLLICGGCGRWFPIAGGIPELLPDHLRDWRRDVAFLTASGLPTDIRALLRTSPSATTADEGANFKRAEISIRDRVSDPGFWGPGYSSPFNAANPHFTLRLITVFANLLPLVELDRGCVVIDIGVGYAWTTDWLFRSGFEAIGVDITRPYLEIAAARLGPSRPHLVVADVEALPLASATADLVLAFESFHHVPDRRRAMASFARVLTDRGSVLLAEPGATHQHSAVAVETMTAHGILEKGMDLADVEDYVAGLPFERPEQHHVLRMTTDQLSEGIALPASDPFRVTDSNIYRVRKARPADAGRARGPAATARPVAESGGLASAAGAAAIAVAEPFDAYYFAHCCGRPYGRDPEWLEFFGTIADRIVSDIQPRRVLDAGCAYGLLVEALRGRGVEAWGIDISDHAIARVDDGVKAFCRRRSIAQDFGERYDLIVCIEVLEHMTPADAEAALDNICRHTDDVLFSSTPRDYEEPTHVNVHPPEHWAELFARRGFFRDVDHDASYVTSWAARFRRSREPVHRLVRDCERRVSAVLAERGDNRRFTARVQRELANALRALEEMRRTHAGQAATLSAQIETTASELREAQCQLNVARDRIAHMEQSAFWKLRGMWVRLAGAIGRRT